MNVRNLLFINLFALTCFSVSAQNFPSKYKLRKFSKSELDVIYFETYDNIEYSSGGLGYEFEIFKKFAKKNSYYTFRNELMFIGPPQFTFDLNNKFVNSMINYNYQKDYLIYKIGLGGNLFSASYTFTPLLNLGLNFDVPKSRVVFGVQCQVNYKINWLFRDSSHNVNLGSVGINVQSNYWFYTFGINIGRYF